MKKTLFNLNFLIILIITLSGTYINAQCIVASTSASPSSTNNSGTYDYVQSFTADCSGDMDYFQLTSTAVGTLPGATLRVYDGNVPFGSPIYTQAYPNIVITNIGDPITIDITGTLPLLVGNQYSFRFTASTLDFQYSSANPYAGGHAWQDGTALSTTDFIFEVSILGPGCIASSISTDVATLSDENGECSVTISTPPTATNNCGTVVNGVPNVTFPITTQGTTQVTWTYDDTFGNVTTQVQDVVIADVTPPVADLATLPDLNNQCETTSLTPPTATDNCGGTIIGTTTTTAPISTLGTSIITWSFDDGNGNVSTQNQTVVNPTIDNIVTVTGATIQANQITANYQWLDCNDAFTPLFGEVNQSFTATVTGSYAVEINVLGCINTSACEIIDFTGIEDLTHGNKELVKIVDLLGRETKFKKNTPLIYIYNDGTMERIMEIEL